MTKKWNPSPETLNEAFLEFAEKYPEASLRKMFGYLCVFINGNMCSGLHEENWIVRLPENLREQFVQEHDAKAFAPMGRPMREYLCLPRSVQEDPELLKLWVERSIDYTSTIPLKVPKKRKKKV